MLIVVFTQGRLDVIVHLHYLVAYISSLANALATQLACTLTAAASSANSSPIWSPWSISCREARYYRGRGTTVEHLAQYRAFICNQQPPVLSSFTHLTFRRHLQVAFAGP